MKNNEPAALPDKGEFEEQDIIIQLGARNEAGPHQVHIFLARQSGRQGKPDHNIANLTLVSGGIDCCLYGVDSHSLRRMAEFFTRYADLLETNGI